jgi:hypothetical protein
LARSTSTTYKELYGRRNDAEAQNRMLDDSLWPGRAHSMGAQRHLLDWLGYGLVVNAVARRRSRLARERSRDHGRPNQEVQGLTWPPTPPATKPLVGPQSRRDKLGAGEEQDQDGRQDRVRLVVRFYPGFSTKFSTCSWGRSSVARAPALHAGGRGFESHRLHHKLAAQGR